MCTNLTNVSLTSKFTIFIKFDVSTKLKVVYEFHANHISVQYFLFYFKQDLPTFLEAVNEKQKCITYTRHEDPQIIFGIFFGAVNI